MDPLALVPEEVPRGERRVRRANYHALTLARYCALGQEAESWRCYVEMVELILRTT